VVLQAASPGYLQSMRIPLKLGRDLAASDDTRAPLVAMISARLAKDFWPDEDPIGRRLKLGDAQDASRPWLTVVGVTGDVLHDSLGNGPQSTVYLPLAQATLRDMHVGIRALGQPEMLARAARREVQALDRDLPIYQVRTMEGIREAALIGVRGMAWVMGALSVLALLVAAIGVYSMMAYAVAERTREFGIRVAVGATSGGLMAEVLRRGLNVAIGGALAGLCLAGAASRLIGTAIAGMAKADSLTFAVVAGAMTIAAIAASIAPARRATQVDPVVALRAE
jgi:putative ABC transport system permease protein